MRMWMINPKILCKKHLLGEHGELHKHRWTFEKKHKKDKYIENNCIEPKSMKERHDELANELKRRRYNHNSPFKMPDINYLPKKYRDYSVDRQAALEDLLARCSECKKRYEKERRKRYVSIF